MSQDPSIGELVRMMGDLDRRLRRIEERLSDPVEPAPFTPVQPEAAPQPLFAPIAAEPLAVEPVQPSNPAEPLQGLVDRDKIFPLPARPQRSLESTIGENWAGWIGAIVFVLGVLFFLKYAWDQGWIRPTPTMRIVAAIVTGLVISGIGERMHRTGVRVLAAVLHGAGLAIVLASFFGAHVLFDPHEQVLSLGRAFTGVVLTAAAGIFIALHINSIVLALIALIGAYLAPIILNTGQDRSVEFLSYLAVLAAAGLSLSHLKRDWGWIRSLVWITTVVMVFQWWLNFGERNGHEMLSSGFVSLFFAMFMGEMVLTLRRWGDDVPQALGKELAILSLLNTAFLAAMLRLAWQGSEYDVMLGLGAVAVAGVHGGAAFVTRSREFSISSLLQSAALLTLAVPLLTDQFVITLAWLALAAALSILAWQLNISAARGWAMILLILSIGRFFLADSSLRSDIVISGEGWRISQWTGMGWATAILAHALAWIRPGAPGRFPLIEQRFARAVRATHAIPSRQPAAVSLDYAAPVGRTLDTRFDPLGALLGFIGTGVFYLVTVIDFRDPLNLTLWLLWLVPILLLAPLARRIGYFHHAAFVGFIMTLHWFINTGAGPLAEQWNRPREAAMPVLNMVAFNGAFMIALVIGLLMQGRRMLLQNKEVLLVWLAGLIFAWVNLEALRAVDWLATGGVSMRDPAIVKHVVMSVLWALMGFGMVVAGFRSDRAELRYVGLGLLGITLGKILLVDMAEVRAVWRILSFLAVGALLLGVSFVYHRQTRQEATTP